MGTLYNPLNGIYRALVPSFPAKNQGEITLNTKPNSPSEYPLLGLGFQGFRV